jgi:hypothetical protein
MNSGYYLMKRGNECIEICGEIRPVNTGVYILNVAEGKNAAQTPRA